MLSTMPQRMVEERSPRFIRRRSCECQTNLGYASCASLRMSLAADGVSRKMSDGMFLTACRAVAKDYPKIKYTEDLLDRVCLRIAQDPSPFSQMVMVMPNL